MRTLALAIATFLAVAGCTTLGGDAERREDCGGPEVSRERALLWNDPYDRLLVEVDHVEGTAPSGEVLDAFLALVQELTGKRKVEILPSRSIPSEAAQRAGDLWELEELHVLHAATFDAGCPGRFGAGDTAFLHAIYIDAPIDHPNGPAAGVSWRNVVYVVDENAIVSGSAVPTIADPSPTERPDPFLFELGTLQHEFGHAIGLVDNGIPMVRPHADPADPAHSSNKDSIMSSEWDSVSFLRTMALRGDEPKLRFDDDDLADIRAFRESERPAP